MALAHHHPYPGRRPRPSILRRAERMPVRAEPALAFPPAVLASWSHEPANVVSLRGCDPLLETAPGEPLAAPHATTTTSLLGWRDKAVGFSVLFHVAVAAFFLQMPGDTVEIAGGAVPQVALLGNAPEDALSAGEGPPTTDAGITSVTLVTMLEAEPVTVTDEAITPMAVEQVSAAEAAIEPVAPDEVATVAPVEAARVDPVTADIAPAADDVAASPAPPPAQVVETVEPLEPIAPSATLTPEVLTAVRIEPADSVDAVPPVSQSLGPPLEPVAEVSSVVPAAEAPVAAPATQVARAVPVEETAVVAPVEEPPVKAERRAPAPRPAPPEPKPAKAKPAKAKPAETKVAETKRPAKKDREKQPAGKPAAKSGSKGKAQADARRGVADGAANGSSAATGKGRAQSTAAGNAAVTNYPGKIVSKLRRALRYPAEARSRNLKGEVQVSFTVSAGGGVGGVRVVRSSGSPVLDRAAIETVRRAAPFPPIPDGAGRSSWPFTVPLAFTR